MKKTTSLYNLLQLDSFTLFPEYFISVSGIYVLIVAMLITYNVYGLMIQKAVSKCLALMLLMSCYILLNDDLLTFYFFILGDWYYTNFWFESMNNFIINDYFSFFTKFIICFSSALYFYIISDFLKKQQLTSFEYLLINLFAVIGLVLLCSSNDFLTAYLAIELSSLAFYLLASFKKTSNYSVESGLKYLITGAVSSAFFLLGSSFIYGATGFIHFSDLQELFDEETVGQTLPECIRVGSGPLTTYELAEIIANIWYFYQYPPTPFRSSLVDLGLSLIIFSLFIKLGLAPFHLWSLDVFEGSPTSSAFFFAVISKLSIFVLLIRLCYKTFYPVRESWIFYSLSVAVLSIFVGSFGGLKVRKLKTLLAYSSTSHMGYSLLAFSVYTQKYLCVEMVFLYLIVYITAGLLTWFIILSLRIKHKTLKNKHNRELGDLALLNRSNSALAFSLALTMFSVAGIPPLIGFISKIGVFTSVVQGEIYLIALATILCSVVSTFYYIRVIKVLFFENILVGKLYYPLNNKNILLLSLLTFLLIFLFINPTLLYLIIRKMTEHLIL